MEAKTYIKVSAINLAFLICGCAVGIYIGSAISVRQVHAQQDFEEISPGVTTGTMAIGTLLASRIATDQLSIQGVDLLKLHQNTINYLVGKVGTMDGWRGVIADSKMARPLRMTSPKQERPESPKPDAKKDAPKQ